MCFACYAAYKQPFSVWVSVLIFIGLWWFGLIALASQPAAGYFAVEREFISKFRHTNSSTAKQVLGLAIFYLLYWPIFIPKGIYLALLILGGCLYYYLRSRS
jgi:hypothetical protein